MRRSLLALLLLLFLVAQAHAQSPDDKSPAVAVGLSVGVTTAGVIALASGGDSLRTLGLLTIFVGPSTGRWYAGDSSISGLGWRALGGATMVYGLVTALQDDCDEEDTTCDGTFESSAGLLMLAGAGLWVGSSIADVVLAERAARDWNTSHALALSPTSFATPQGHANGLALTGRF